MNPTSIALLLDGLKDSFGVMDSPRHIYILSCRTSGREGARNRCTCFKMLDCIQMNQINKFVFVFVGVGSGVASPGSCYVVQYVYCGEKLVICWIGCTSVLMANYKRDQT